MRAEPAPEAVSAHRGVSAVVPAKWRVAVISAQEGIRYTVDWLRAQYESERGCVSV